MKSVCKLTGFKRISSLLLALLIVLSLVPLQSVHVHAAATLSVSKAEVELGEGILVTATSDVAGDWVGIYQKGAVPSGSVASYYWYYVNGSDSGKTWKSGNTYNIFNAVPDANHGALDGLPVGQYDVVLLAADYTEKARETVSIVPVSDGEKPTPSLTVTKNSYSFGEEVRYTATSYKEGAWIGLYDETLTAESEIPSSLNWQYIQGRNGTEDIWYNLTTGDYSIVLFDDLSNYIPDAVVNFTVEEPAVALLTADKQEYAYGADMKIMASVVEDYQGGKNAGYWVGLYKKGEDPNGTTSIKFNYTAAESFNVMDCDGERAGELKSGVYDLWLLQGEIAGSYTKLAKVTITITAEIDESKTVKVNPTCTAHGTITYTYTDGSVKTVTYPEDPSLKKLDHDYTYTSKGEKHDYDCKNCDDAGTADCTWNEGVETKPATQTEKGEMTYTCTKCGGTKKVATPALGATPTGETKVVEPTCTKPGYTRVFYSDGSYKDENPTEPKGHAYANGKHIDGTRTHTVTCSRNCGEPNATATQDCVLETNGLYESNALKYSCPSCGTWYESITPTDKTEYAFGEEIMVFLNPDYQGLENGDWVGLYKRNETPTKDVNRAIYWVYTSDIGEEGFPLISGGTGGDRESEFVADNYTIYLISSGYKVKAARNITIVAKETERKTTKPTCTEDGYITAYYDDGTEKVVVTAADDESLKATGHNYEGVKPTYNGAEQETHSAACKNGCGVLNTTPCQWDGGKVIEEATTAKDGKKEFTCTVCGGKKYEVITVKTVKETVKQDPTCEEPGFTYNVYSDDSQSEKTTIAALGHNWGEWKFDGQAAGTHSRACANNTMDSCKQTESCDFNVENKNGEVTYTCKVCGGTFTGRLLYVPDKTLGVNDDIVFIPYKGGDSVWVGLYKDGESPSASTPSLYWKYITAEQVGTKLTVQDDLDYNQTRSEAIGNGTYNLMMFGDSGYTNIIATETIEIFTDMSNTTWEIQLDGVKKENGSHTNVAKADLGTKAPLNVKVTATGEAGASWWGLYQGKVGLDTDFNSAKYYGVYQYVKWGEEGITLTTQSQLDLDVGDYSIVLFEDGTYNLPIQVITFSITRPIASQQVEREATCEMPGIVNVVYEDDGDPSTSETATIITDPLGHQWEKWSSTGNNSHTRKCTRNTGATCTQTEACIFAGTTCTVCGGEQTHVHSTKKVAAVNPTCDAEGNSVYYTCNCGKWFSDASATKEITDKTSVVKAALGHKYGKWTYNAGAKTHTRTCDNNKAHVESEACTFDAGVLDEKTRTKKFTCTVCGGSYSIEVGAKRVAGSTRYTTALAVADQLKQTLGVSKFQNIVVASGTDFADALAGSYLANQKNAPILLVRNQQKELTRVKEYIHANLASGGTVYLLGGEKAIPKAMETGLDGFNVKRLAGATRYDTNLAILKEVGTNGQEILVCTGKEFADGLSASAVNKPILLVKGSKLSDAQVEFLKGLGRSQFYIVGGENAVSAKMEKALSAYGAVVRINGATRYVTSANIAKTFFPKSDYVVMAYGVNFPDGLSGGPLAFSLKAPLLLVADGKQAPAVNYAKAAGVSAGMALGGDKTYSNATADAIVPKN